jgi:hypothetical protein
MIRILTLLLFLALSTFSCKKNSEREEPIEYATDRELSPALKSESPVVGLNKESEELVKNWKEYQDFSELIVQYREITKSDALLNSIELEELAQYLKDSVRVEKLDIPAVRMRLNVLHNEAKRLSDMSTIPTITDEEVLAENNNVLDAFAALNIKINDLGKQEKINRELSEFNDRPEVGNDSLEIGTFQEASVLKDTVTPSVKDTLSPAEKLRPKKIVKQVN